jgi:hypothetical protein
MQFPNAHPSTVVKMRDDDPDGRWKRGDVGVAREAAPGQYAVSLPGGQGEAPRSILADASAVDTSLGAMQTHVVSIQPPNGEPLHDLQEWTDLELVHHCARYGINKPSSDLRMPYVWFHSGLDAGKLLELHIFSSNGQEPQYQHYERIRELLESIHPVEKRCEGGIYECN